MFALVNNHAFVDGNKRIGVFVMLITLKLNGVVLEYTQNELTSLGLMTASGQADYNDILKFIKQHKKNKS